jgi:hypothetical protein
MELECIPNKETVSVWHWLAKCAGATPLPEKP